MLTNEKTNNDNNNNNNNNNNNSKIQYTGDRTSVSSAKFSGLWRHLYGMLRYLFGTARQSLQWHINIMRLLNSESRIWNLQLTAKLRTV